VRVVVVADIHANLEAFQSVLEDALGDGPIDAVWSLGDLVGYGPEPSACIRLLRSHPQVAVAGNHDLAATGAIGIDDFNPFAAEAARWTANALSEEEKTWLRGLPEVLVQEDFTLVHGSLRDPVWEYLVSPAAAEAHLALQRTPFSLVGHSHIPLCFKENGRWIDAQALQDGATVDFGDSRLVLNPGSVGQPRDGDLRASYAILDTEARRWQLHRFPYNIAATQRKMMAAGLPEYLIERLARGR
jgi:predicted phosphodiesterase